MHLVSLIVPFSATLHFYYFLRITFHSPSPPLTSQSIFSFDAGSSELLITEPYL